MDTQKIIQSIVWTATRERGAISRIRLIKFLYLADVLLFRKEGRVLTNYAWKFYHYGPWAQEAQKDIDRAVEGRLIEMDKADGEAGDVYLYMCRGQDPEIWRELGVEFEMGLRREVKHWLGEPLEQFLDYIYFDTPHMRDARRADVLKFVPELPEPPALKPSRTKRGPVSEKGKEAFAKFLAGRKAAAQLPKDAIYDALYTKAAAMLDAEDITPAPIRGSAEIGKEAGLKDGVG